MTRGPYTIEECELARWRRCPVGHATHEQQAERIAKWEARLADARLAQELAAENAAE